MMANYEHNFEHMIFITPVFLWHAEIIIQFSTFVHLTQDKFVYLLVILSTKINISNNFLFLIFILPEHTKLTKLYQYFTKYFTLIKLV